MRRCLALGCFLLLTGCSCLPDSTLDQSGMSARPVEPSHITSADEIGQEPQG